MSTTGLVIVALLALAGLWLWVLAPTPRDVSTAVPGRLKGAKIWAKELYVKTSRPDEMQCRLDEAWQLPETDEIVLSETKTRRQARVFDSDILQLSAQRVVLMNARPDLTVSKKGYVRVLTKENGNSYVPVNLVDEESVARAAELYRALQAGENVGERCKNRALCTKCAYKEPCNEMAA